MGLFIPFLVDAFWVLLQKSLSTSRSRGCYSILSSIDFVFFFTWKFNPSGKHCACGVKLGTSFTLFSNDDAVVPLPPLTGLFFSQWWVPQQFYQALRSCVLSGLPLGAKIKSTSLVAHFCAKPALGTLVNPFHILTHIPAHAHHAWEQVRNWHPAIWPKTSFY